MNTQTSAGSVTTKYLTFRMSGEEYGIEILKTREIIRMTEITRVPGTPAFIKGVINLRGRIIPVIDLRTRLELPAKAASELTCILITEIQHARQPLTMGVMIDEIGEVVELAPDAIEPPPEFGTTVHVDYLRGIARHENRVVVILNIERILSREELQVLQGTTFA